MIKDQNIRGTVGATEANKPTGLTATTAKNAGIFID